MLRFGHGRPYSGLPAASWRPFGKRSPWNIGTANANVHSNSDAMADALISLNPSNTPTITYTYVPSDQEEDWGHPTYWARPTDPQVEIEDVGNFGISTDADGHIIRCPADALPANGSDHHLTIVQPDGTAYDFWNADVSTPGKIECWQASRIDLNHSTGVMPNTNPIQGGGGTASFIPNTAGIIRAEEMLEGEINHALFGLVLRCAGNDSFGFGATQRPPGNQSYYVWPARKGDQIGTSQHTELFEDLPPMGAWLTLDYTDNEINNLSIPDYAKIVIRAIKDYGIIIGDTSGSNLHLSMESGRTYTSFGKDDLWEEVADTYSLPEFDGKRVMNIRTGVDWANRLRVLEPLQTW